MVAASEPYPGRWTHHLLLTAPEDVDGLLAALKTTPLPDAVAYTPREEAPHAANPTA